MHRTVVVDLVAAHRAVYADLREAVADLAPAAWTTETGCPGWDVHDQVAHVVAVERTMLGDPGDEVEVPGDLPHVRNEFGRQVEVGVQARRSVSPGALLAEAEETFERRLDALERLDPERLGEPIDGPGGMRVKASQMLRTRVFDMTCHVDDIRRAVQRPGPPTGPHRTIAVEQVLRAWAKLLPERLDEDRPLGIELEGHGTFTIALSDGVLHRDGDGPPPAASVRLTSSELLALACGRSDAPTLAGLAVDGDERLAAAWLGAASITP
jgi:uncharacterized protein (TIGR03083 family)